MGLALPLMDAVLSEAKQLLPADSGLATQIVDLISVEQIESGEGIRAVDASIVVGQLVAAVTTLLDEKNARDAEALESDKELLPLFLDLLPPSGPAVQHLRHHQFHWPYEYDDAEPLWVYCNQWTRPDQRFQSARLAPLDKAFRDALEELYTHDALQVFTLDDGRRRIHPDQDLDCETAANRYVFDAIRTGGSLLATAYDAYERLADEARRALR